MKQSLTLTTMVLMIGLLAVCAYAQEQPGPNETKEPRENYNNVPGASGNGGIHRNGGDNQHPDGDGSYANGDPDGQGPQLKPGPDSDKLFIDEDGDGINDNCIPQENLYGGENGTAAMSGTMNRFSYGPGEPQPTEGLGPMDGSAAFGPGESSCDGEPAGTSVPTASQSRAGGSK